MIGVFISTLIVHASIGYWLVVILKMELLGIALCNTLSNLMNLIMLTMISLRIDHLRGVFHMPDREAFKGIKDYLKLGLPSMLLWCMKSWAYAL